MINTKFTYYIYNVHVIYKYIYNVHICTYVTYYNITYNLHILYMYIFIKYINILKFI